MKLYTEKQVMQIARQVKEYGYYDNLNVTPIELPSDEEIKSELRKIAVGDVMNENGEFIKSTIGVDDNIIWAIRGAKWMKQQILKQKK